MRGDDAAELTVGNAVATQHDVAPADARPLRRRERPRRRRVDDAQRLVRPAVAHQRRHVFLGHRALQLRVGFEAAPQHGQRLGRIVAIEEQQPLEVAGPRHFVGPRLHDVLQCLGGLRKLGAGQFLLHVVGREHIGIGEAHDLLGADSDQRSDVGCGSRTRDRRPRAVAPPQLQRERVAVARDFSRRPAHRERSRSWRK